MKTAFKHRSVKHQLLVLEIFLVIVLIFSSLTLVTNFHYQIERQSVDHSSVIIDEASLNINNTLRSVNSLVQSLILNEDLKTLCQMNNYADDYATYLKAEQFISMLNVASQDINTLALVSQQRKIYFSNNMKGKHEFIETNTRALQKTSNLIYIGEYQDPIEGLLLGFSVNMFNATYSQVIGQIVVLLNPTFIQNNIQISDGQLFFVDDNRGIIFANNSTKKKPIKEITSSNSHWFIDMPYSLEHHSRSYFSSDTLVVGVIYLILLLIILMIIILIYFFISRNMLVPLKEITSFISNINHGHLRQLKKRIGKKGPHEIQVISQEINNLLQEVHDLSHRLIDTTTRLYTIDLEKSKAELEYLRSQVNPHFLYNTLGIIKGIASLKNEQEIVSLSDNLVNMFRFSIKGEDLVPLAKELDICKSYIEIQQFRFDNRFSVEYDIDEDLNSILIQKMLLQPLIENAIEHGIEPISRLTTLQISCHRQDNCCKITVQDNGVGIEPIHLKEIHNMLESSGKGYSKEHIGIFNINSRLVNYYGADSHLNIESSFGMGTKVFFSIPI